MAKKLIAKKIAISGGFDPLHTGHLKMIKEASEFGDVIVFLNSDDFLMKKKDYVFMNFAQRKELLESIKWVKEVVAVIDKDQTVCGTLKKYKPDIFANGGDRTRKNIPEVDTCKHLGIKMIFGIGGKKIQSSSDLVKAIKYRDCGLNLGDK